MRRALCSALRLKDIRALFNLILVDHLVDLLDHAHLLLDDLLKLLNLLGLLSVQELAAGGLSHLETIRSIIFHRHVVVGI